MDYAIERIRQNIGSSDSSSLQILDKMVNGSTISVLRYRLTGDSTDYYLGVVDGVLYLNDVDLTSEHIEITNYNVILESYGEGGAYVIIQMSGNPKYGRYKDEILITREVSVTSNSFEVGYD